MWIPGPCTFHASKPSIPHPRLHLTSAAARGGGYCVHFSEDKAKVRGQTGQQTCHLKTSPESFQAHLSCSGSPTAAPGDGVIEWPPAATGAPARYSLVHVALGAGREVCLHHRLELCLVAAVFENRVVMVTAENEGFVVREPGAVEAKVIAAFVVRIRLTDPEMRRQDWKTEARAQWGASPSPLPRESTSAGTGSPVSLFYGAASLFPPQEGFVVQEAGSRLMSCPRPPSTPALLPCVP